MKVLKPNFTTSLLIIENLPNQGNKIILLNQAKIHIINKFIDN